MVKINGIKWLICFVEPYSKELRRTDRTYMLGVTNIETKRVFIANNLPEIMTRKVICHELCHVFCASYGIYMSIDEEERLADWVATYGTELMRVLDELMSKIKGSLH